MKRKKIDDTFGCDLFEGKTAQKYLSAPLHRAWQQAQINAAQLDEAQLDQLAAAIGKWAAKKGVTHYTHWFAPYGNGAVGKREGLFCPINGGAKAKFGLKELCCCEVDASSFPSGGLRSAFAAKGITSWDVTSPPFVIEDCLYIPCTLCGAGGEALDRKTPLLRSNVALRRQAVRVLKALGYRTTDVYSAVGAEQEYFLVDKALCDMRADLCCCGRTLFGADPQLHRCGHYLAPIDEETLQFVRSVDNQLWRLGIAVKTEHSEVSPRQFELVPCHMRAQRACDANLIAQEILLREAAKRNMTCLLHEKPFAYVNGSGKHNNWSIVADGENLLEAGNTPAQNMRFLLMLAAVIKGADDYCELLLAAVSSHGNDCRLGGCEAPPQVLTVFLGRQLSKAVRLATNGKWRYGVDILPRISSNAERNRTSPFAFTGNKFEFRSVGASGSLADVNTALNVAVAESLRQFADVLERSIDVCRTVGQIVTETFAQHKRILFDGDNYDPLWAAEAKRRGLKSYTAVQAAMSLTNAHNVNVLERHNVLTFRETQARRQILLQQYADTVMQEGAVAICCNATYYALPVNTSAP